MTLPEQPESSVPALPPPVFNVDAKAALRWTLVWTIGLAAYTVGPHIVGTYDYRTYKGILIFAISLLAVLTIVGVSIAWKFIGGSKESRPWYTSGFLVALLIFWALAPPLWFFLEYYMFDNSQIQTPQGMRREQFLLQLKVYSDLASKVWAAAGASLGAAVAAARK